MPETERLSVCLGTITDGNVRVEVDMSIWRAEQDLEWRARIVQPSGPYLDVGRNKVVRRFLNYPGYQDVDQVRYEQDWLYFYDSDVPMRPHTITDLIDAAEKIKADCDRWPIIGGAYLGVFEGKFCPIAYRWEIQKVRPVEADGKKQWLPLADDAEPRDGDSEHWTLKDIPKAEIEASEDPIEVSAIGTGSMLIHRSILEEMRVVFHEPQPWFIEGPVGAPGLEGEEMWMGEDLQFCLRAATLNHPIYVHAGVKLVHHKTIGLAFETRKPEQGVTHGRNS